MAVKRWVKDLGNPIMALVILTEPKPYEALGIVLGGGLLVVVRGFAVTVVGVVAGDGVGVHDGTSPSGTKLRSTQTGRRYAGFRRLPSLARSIQKRRGSRPR